MRGSAGFTIIELLVVFSLIAMLSGIGLVSFVNYSRSQAIIQSANNFKLLITQARFDAISSVKTNIDPYGNKIDCQTQTLQGFEIDVVQLSANSQLNLSQLCSNLSPQLIRSKALPNGVNIDPVNTTCVKITFNALSGMPGGVNCAIALKGQNGATKTITVDSGGNVLIQ